MDRRSFLRALLASGMGGIGAPLLNLSNANAATPAFDDYKALVCLYLFGGNDAFNMVVPIGDESGSTAIGQGHQTYGDIRGNLTVAADDLDLATNFAGGLLGSGSGNPYYVDGTQQSAYVKGVYPLGTTGLGFNGVMPELAQLYSDNRLAVINNVGTLVEPTTKANIGSIDRPPFLFAHNHQQRALQTGWADNLSAAGWAGRLADLWGIGRGGVNNNHTLGMNISYAGSNRMLIGDTSTPVNLNAGDILTYAGMEDGSSSEDLQRKALFRGMNGQNAGSDPLRGLYNNMLTGALSMSDLLITEWPNTPDFAGLTGPYGEALFGRPDSTTLGFTANISSSLFYQLESVAKMASLGKRLGLNRQIFVVSMGGFDNHSVQLERHPRLLRQLSLSLWKFQRAIDSLGMGNEVTLFTQSDFGRTMSNNGDGTDHAWGTDNLIVGGCGQQWGLRFAGRYASGWR
ncbi:DUF1501 domain-containing protein [Candidatus Reidiella endopervernicosa]|nr:DUF1501 domain-containing protein [Solemya pervernicosa gill symbiont]QKQ25165.1 DUF1501 domain-containing protein [Candidatus Reidiella endopervernicosa]